MATTLVLVLVLVVLYGPWILHAISSLFSIVHVVQELLDDGAPIWRYLGLPVPHLVGFVGLVLFFSAQIWLSYFGYVGGHRWALWALLTVRLGDCVVSHWWPWIRGRRPNPGLTSTPLYAIEVALLGYILA